MTTPTERRAGPFDRRLARRATGVLAEANRADLLTAADVHVAGRLATLLRVSDPSVVLAVALAVRAVRTGSVACDLRTVREHDPDFDWPSETLDPQAWLALVAASPFVAQGILRIEFDLIYLDRYWEQEVEVARILHERAALPAPEVDSGLLDAALGRLFPEDVDADQRAAGQTATRHRTTIVTGGPGTGKTTTVAKILALLAEQHAATGSASGLRVALVAPTAKAANRLGEAFAHARGELPEHDRARVPDLLATTLHRLLGWNPSSRSRFRHNRTNRLPHDVVVLDEASMVSLTLMARLLEALRPAARLIVVGDPDQLASVEAGAVLADLVAGLEGREPPGRIARLGHTYRYGGSIGALAEAIRAGDSATTLRLLTGGDPRISLLPDAEPRRGLLVASAVTLHERALDGDARGALDALAAHRLLCAHRTGPTGVSQWNRAVAQWLSEELGENFWAPYYPGRPLLVTTNDYGMDLFNGDTGVVLRRGGRLVAAFDRGRSVREVAAARLSDVETMYAATVHKSQGSQAHRVTVILPDLDSPLLTRELIYTAVTRAQDEVSIIGSPAAIEAGLARRSVRASGLRQRLLRDFAGTGNES